jgi:hypothetical protein
VLKLIQQMLKAGYEEKGQRYESTDNRPVEEVVRMVEREVEPVEAVWSCGCRGNRPGSGNCVRAGFEGMP